MWGTGVGDERLVVGRRGVVVWEGAAAMGRCMCVQGGHGCGGVGLGLGEHVGIGWVAPVPVLLRLDALLPFVPFSCLHLTSTHWARNAAALLLCSVLLPVCAQSSLPHLVLLLSPPPLLTGRL